MSPDNNEVKKPQEGFVNVYDNGQDKIVAKPLPTTSNTQTNVNTQAGQSTANNQSPSMQTNSSNPHNGQAGYGGYGYTSASTRPVSGVLSAQPTVNAPQQKTGVAAPITVENTSTIDHDPGKSDAPTKDKDMFMQYANTYGLGQADLNYTANRKNQADASQQTNVQSQVQTQPQQPTIPNVWANSMLPQTPNGKYADIYGSKDDETNIQNLSNAQFNAVADQRNLDAENAKNRLDMIKDGKISLDDNYEYRDANGNLINPTTGYLVDEKTGKDIITDSQNAITSATEKYYKDNPNLKPEETTKEEPKDTRSAYQKFRDSLYDEEKLKQESDKRRKISAVGEALRNLGNLYYTSRGAKPQTFSTSPTVQEQQAYETGYNNREAIAQKRYNTQLAEDKAKADAELKRLQLNSTLELNAAKTKQIYQKMGIDEKKAPVELQKMAAEYVNLLAQGKYHEAQAKEQTIKAAYAEALQKAELDVKKSTVDRNKKQGTAAMINANNGTRRTNAYISQTKASIEKIRHDIKKDSDEKEPTITGQYATFRKPKKALDYQQKSVLAKNLIKAGKADVYKEPLKNAMTNYDREDIYDDIIADALYGGEKQDTWDILADAGYVRVNSYDSGDIR